MMKTQDTREKERMQQNLRIKHILKITRTPQPLVKQR